MGPTNMLAVAVFVLVSALGLGLEYLVYGSPTNWVMAAPVGVALLAAFSIKVAYQWERVVVLRLGSFRSLRGPGPFLIVPVIDTMPYRIDTRVITTAFSAEKTLTKDTVPVDVDAVLFWKVVDPKKAALDVNDYQTAIHWAAQTALRDVIGKTDLSEMLEGREKISAEIGRIIDERTEPWGIHVISVEVKDVLIPAALQDAMSMQAQAERERQARVILGESERQIAEKFEDAARSYADNPTALHLRAMNMLYEGLKQNATIVIVPSTAADSMQLGSIAGITAITSALQQKAPEPTNQKTGARPAALVTSLIGGLLLLCATPKPADAATYVLVPQPGGDVFIDCPERPEGKSVTWINSTCVTVDPSRVDRSRVETIDIGELPPGQTIAPPLGPPEDDLPTDAAADAQ
jgi:regulator of protease activity HflC (stomatin/prohibitin superfamily)